ncbi:uncharacterized protein LOC143914207 [Arctopsyche grandis]|uniref:uncharacterized protein LOC143914207 n=1 Tax=Arctopsyche grandis TaxID=121162 RepID=UPI00406D87CB
MDKRVILFLFISLLHTIKGTKQVNALIKVIAPERNGTAKFQMDFYILDTVLSCDMKLPNGSVYELYPKSNLSDPNVVKASDSYNQGCGFKILNVTSNYTGNYELVAEVDALFEDRKTIIQPLNVLVEEKVNMVPVDAISVFTGQNVEFYLSESLDSLKKCEISPPKMAAQKNYSSNSNDCLVKIENITKEMNGVWNVSAVGDITLFSNLNITVKDIPQIEPNIDIALGVPATLTLGPPEAIFCRATNPLGSIVVQNIGQCVVEINRVTQKDAGKWTVDVGLMGSISTIQYEYIVLVNDLGEQNEGEILARSEYAKNGSYARIECTLLVKSMNSCLITRADGKVFILNEGIGMDRYKYYSNKTDKLENGVDYVSCGIHIDNPTSFDLDPWKCEITHSDNVQTSSIISVRKSINSTTDDQSVGFENTATEAVNATVNSPFQMMCSYSLPISYCWFKSPNGTIISILPGTVNDNYTYAGNGLKTGQCGILIKNPSKSDDGIWKCNVGTEDTKDLSTDIKVKIYKTPLAAENKNYILSIEKKIACKTFDKTSLEYCRFIRPDGQGINANTNSNQYSDNGTNLEDGVCNLILSSPSTVDIGTWLCIGKPHFKDVEYFDEFYVDSYYYYYYHVSVIYIIFWFLFTAAMTFIIVVCMVNLYKIFTRRYRARQTTSSSPSQSSNISELPSYDAAVLREDIQKMSLA